jgi:hypothetical protein
MQRAGLYRSARWWPSWRRGPVSLGIPMALASLAGCGGGTPLLHPAHVLRPGHAAIGAGFSGRLTASSDLRVEGEEGVDEASTSANGARIEDVALAPGVAPFVAGRVGIDGDNEAGITYTARAFRIDARHAFHVGPLFISAGLGGSVVFPKARKENDEDVGSATGGGADLPLLFGVRSASDLYAVWIGPRGGFEFLRGELRDDSALAPDPSIPGGAPPGSDLVDFDASHGFIGGLVGMRVGFRHFHVALETSASYHRVSGELGSTSATIDYLDITPAGAAIISF